MTGSQLHSTLSELDGATEWINSEPLTHAPEFAFEQDLDGVSRALHELRVHHPVVLDNDDAIWRSLGNRYWPALYLVDGDGRVRYRHFGEGAYDETESAIRELTGADRDPVRAEVEDLEAAADWDTLNSLETYVGSARSERRRGRGAEGLSLNQWALRGQWTVEEEHAVLDAGPGSLAYRFQARDLNLVLAAAADVPFTVLLDGEPPGEAHGLHVDELGRGTVSAPRMYQLVRQRGGARERTFEITFRDPGVRGYVFTFG